MLTHNDLTGRDPIESLVNVKPSTTIRVPFSLAQLKKRHKRLLLNLNPKVDVDELSNGCSSIDSDTYKPQL